MGTSHLINLYLHHFASCEWNFWWLFITYFQQCGPGLPAQTGIDALKEDAAWFLAFISYRCCKQPITLWRLTNPLFVKCMFVSRAFTCACVVHDYSCNASFWQCVFFIQFLPYLYHFTCLCLQFPPTEPSLLPSDASNLLKYLEVLQVKKQQARKGTLGIKYQTYFPWVTATDSTDVCFKEYVFSATSPSLGHAAKHHCQNILPNTLFDWNLTLFKTEIHNIEKTYSVEKWHVMFWLAHYEHPQLLA